MTTVGVRPRASRIARLRLERAAPFVISCLVVVVGIAVTLVVVALAGHSISATLNALVAGAFGDSASFAGTLEVMVPLVLIGLAWILATAARQVNLGLEGQILAGGICATIVGIHGVGLPTALHLPLAILAGAAGGAAYAAIPAVLSLRRQVSVILSTFMLNFVAILLVSWLVRGPLQDPTSSSLLQSKPVALSASWPLLGTSGLTWDVMWIPVAVLLMVFMQRRTAVGFRLRLINANDTAARHAGIRTARIGALALIASGAIAGVVGSSLILASPGGVMTDDFSSNYGFIGIAVALVARNSPVGCIGAGLLFAALQQGGGLVETRVGVPSTLVEITQGLMIVLLAGSSFLLARATNPSRRKLLASFNPEATDGAV